MQEQILQFIMERFRPQTRGAFDDETPLFSSGIVDSFGVLELIAFLEDTFAVTIDPAKQDLADFDTVRKMVALISQLRGVVAPG